MINDQADDMAQNDAEIAIVREELRETLIACCVARILGEESGATLLIGRAQELVLGELHPAQIARMVFLEMWPEVMTIAYRRLEEMDLSPVPVEGKKYDAQDLDGY